MEIKLQHGTETKTVFKTVKWLLPLLRRNHFDVFSTELTNLFITFPSFCAI